MCFIELRTLAVVSIRYGKASIKQTTCKGLTHRHKRQKKSQGKDGIHLYSRTTTLMFEFQNR